MTKLFQIRNALGLSQVAVAARAGAGVKTIQRIEDGRVAGMRLGTLIRVARALGVSTVELVPGLAVRPSERS